MTARERQPVAVGRTGARGLPFRCTTNWRSPGGHVRAWQMFAIGAAMVGGAIPVEAQFTTAIVPPRRERPAQVRTAAEDSAARDTTIAVRLTDMRAWVDSAAGTLSVRPPSDSARPPSDSATPVAARVVVVDTASREAAASPVRREREARVRRFEDGARAPATASPLALLIVLGAGSMLAGAALRRR